LRCCGDNPSVSQAALSEAKNFAAKYNSYALSEPDVSMSFFGSLKSAFTLPILSQ
jgi:hypothetical protein